MTQLILFNVFNGLIIGAFYALMALGLSLILNLSGVINFAHGGFLAIGAYLAYYADPLCRILGRAGAVAPILTAILGLVVERVLIRRLYGRDPLYSLLLTFGLAFMLRGRHAVSSGVPQTLPFAVPDWLVESAQQRVLLSHRLSRCSWWCWSSAGRHRAVRDPELDAARHAHPRRHARSRDRVGARRQCPASCAVSISASAFISPGSPAFSPRACWACSRPSAPISSCRASSPSSSAGSGSLPGTLVGGLLIGVASGVTTRVLSVRQRGGDLRHDGARAAGAAARAVRRGRPVLMGSAGPANGREAR